MKINSDADRLLQEVHAEDAALRMYALSALAMSGEAFVDRELERGLADGDRDCRATAARMLGERESRDAAPALIAVLLDASSDIAQEAAEALGKIEDPRAVEPLMTVLREHSAPARAAAARALGGLGDLRATPGLAEALGDRTEGVRAEAAESLGELAAQEAIPALVDALGDPSDRVRQSAVSALRRLGPPAIEALLAELRSGEDVRRWRSAWALGECAAPSAVDPLLHALGDPSENVRAQAALALGSIGARRAGKALERATGDSSGAVREAAALALARLGHEPAAPAAAKGRPHLDRNHAAHTDLRHVAGIGLRDARQRRPRAFPRVRLSSLLVVVAVVLVGAVWGVGEALRTRATDDRGNVPVGPNATAPVAPTPTEGTSAGTGGGDEGEKAAPGEGGSTEAGGATNGSLADCQVANPSWQVEGDTLAVRGQVVNSGSATATNVDVRVTVRDGYGEVVARRDGPTTPPSIRPGHSGTFRISMPLPALTSKPTVEAVVRWD